ncbi:MAG TPA: glycosyltransferase family 1 protein [Actinophytocola sp.]|uniref:glycosyltransferase family 4 protein n=1 Tax=Actinophytocola sp. TaxID=1872138 RepID=UPI002DDD2C37|nr:glycosyltransferase family 1 protein [Actinophytocola sp.]HEV2780475.1 glycosyltransferase family 1 protein [Actinophytocola sp.]
MRIAVVTESFLPTVNGVTNSVCQILRHFSDRAHRAMVIAPGPAPREYAGHSVVPVGGIALPGYRSFVLGLPIARLDGLLHDFQPDVVHLASPFALGAAGAAAARRLGLPIVAVFQTDVAGFARQYGFRGTDRAIWAWIRRVHRQADLTLVPSTATLRQLRERGIPRLAMWRRGVDAERFHPRHRDPRLRARLAGRGEVLVGYVGRLSGDKRVHLLAEIADLPGVRLVIAGDGPAARRLRAHLPHARFLGLLHGTELSQLYASLDVFVHSGADETFCQAVQEAMASGVPVVAPASGGPLDLVEHERTGLLYPPESVTALRGAVRQLVNDPGLRETFGNRARDAVRWRTWSAIGDQVIEYYADLIRGNRPAGRRATA